MIRHFLIIIFILGLLNCNEKRLKVSTTDAIKVSNARYDIENTNFKIESSKLIGKWRLKIIWLNRGSIGGVRPIDFYDEYIFTKNHVFYDAEYNKDSSVEHKRLGEFRISKSKNEIYFMFNDKQDTLIKVGDTAHVIHRKVHLLNDSILRIEDYFSPSKKTDIFEYKKIK